MQPRHLWKAVGIEWLFGKIRRASLFVVLDIIFPEPKGFHQQVIERRDWLKSLPHERAERMQEVIAMPENIREPIQSPNAGCPPLNMRRRKAQHLSRLIPVNHENIFVQMSARP